MSLNSRSNWSLLRPETRSRADVNHVYHHIDSNNRLSTCPCRYEMGDRRCEKTLLCFTKIIMKKPRPARRTRLTTKIWHLQKISTRHVWTTGESKSRSKLSNPTTLCMPNQRSRIMSPTSRTCLRTAKIEKFSIKNLRFMLSRILLSSFTTLKLILIRLRRKQLPCGANLRHPKARFITLCKQTCAMTKTAKASFNQALVKK